MNELIAHTQAVSRDELNSLLEHHGTSLVSIIMPVKRVEAEVQQNPIRLKNLLRQAEKELLELGIEAEQAGDILRPGIDLLGENKSYWLHQAAGLALFLGPDTFYSYSLPLDVDERVVVGSRFHVRPLIQTGQDDGRFYILTLNQGGIHLFEASRFSMSEIKLKDVPLSLDEALQYDVQERHVQYHTGTSRQTGGRRTAVFHGQGAAADNARAKNNILYFFRQVDNGVRRVLAENRAPLVLAGVQFLQGIYHEANHYADLVKKGIDVNPEHLNASELHERAWAVVEPLVAAPRTQAMKAYRLLADSGRAANEIEPVIRASYNRRVDTLMVSTEMQNFGLFNPDQNTVERHESRQKKDIDLIDEAVTHTLLNNGKVYVLAQEDMPAEPVAAIFRY